ncbi:hypothetical protein PoB_005084000 [Plakobranchus ocellatus]|uniref:Uncharacterized protein n=1 Tax=Plakobranchus ocellatus TaxID=259542 RepID=A0AAV4BYD3_9GAST|nr:hypothetical protein PoB_005084000 [Plakobranchus ocellatus]
MPLVDKRKPNISIEFHDTSILFFGLAVDFKCSACLEISGYLSWIIIDKSPVNEQTVPLTDPRVTFSNGAVSQANASTAEANSKSRVLLKLAAFPDALSVKSLLQLLVPLILLLLISSSSSWAVPCGTAATSL